MTETAPGGLRPDEEAAAITLRRLEEQYRFYDEKSASAQRAYKRTKLVEIVVAASVPVAAGLQAPAALTASLAAVVVVLEGIHQLYQWQSTWVSYRSTAEALQRERHLYLAGAEAYTGSDRHRVFAERVEALLAQEGTRWVEYRQKSGPTEKPEEKGQA